MPNDDDRRHFQRLHLTKPILALARGSSALILDLGIAGALLEHYGEAAPGEVVRSEVVRPVGGDHLSKVSHSGVQFIGADEESLEALKDLIVTQVGRVLAAPRADAIGER